MKKQLEAAKEIISECYHKYAYYSKPNSDIIAKDYIDQNKSILVNLFETFKEVNVVNGELHFVIGPFEHTHLTDVYSNGGLTICFRQDGDVYFKDAVAPFHHGHLHPMTNKIVSVGCWGNIPPTVNTIRVEGFVQAVINMMQFATKTNDSYDTYRLKEQKVH